MKHSMGMSTTYIYGIKGSILFKNERKNNVTGVAVGEDDRCLGTKRVSLLYVQISSLQVFFYIDRITRVFYCTSSKSAAVVYP